MERSRRQAAPFPRRFVEEAFPGDSHIVGGARWLFGGNTVSTDWVGVGYNGDKPAVGNWD